MGKFIMQNLKDLSDNELIQLQKEVEQAISDRKKPEIKKFIDDDLDVENMVWKRHREILKEASKLLPCDEYQEFIFLLVELNSYSYFFNNEQLLHHEMMIQVRKLQEEYYLVDGVLEHESEIDWRNHDIL